MSVDSLTFEIDGSEYTVDVLEDCAIGALDDDMMEIASKIAWYGQLHALALRDFENRETALKNWRATYVQTVAEKEPKLAEWKAKNKLEASGKYLSHKQALAESRELVNRLSAALDSLKIKSEMLRSIGAWRRLEHESTRMNTKENN